MAINKGKLKRAKKELYRLYNAGSYWTFLKKVEAEEVAEAFVSEIGQSWRLLVKEACSSAVGLSCFLENINTIKALPETPDLKCMLLIRRFTDGEDVSAEAAALKNLSANLSPLIKRMVAFNDKLTDTQVIRDKFTVFTATPELVTKKQYTGLSGIIHGLSTPFLVQLADFLKIVRKCNLKGAVSKKRKGLQLDNLAFVDDGLANLAKIIPDSFFQILILPVLYQFSLIFHNYCQDDQDFIADIVDVAPFLTSLLTGDRWQELQSLLPESDLADNYRYDRKWLRNRIADADFAEKIKLLKNLSSSLMKLEHELDDPFGLGFDDDEDDDLDAVEDAISADYLYLYKNILAEIGTKRATLGSREQKELHQVMAEILHRDFHAFCNNPQQCPEFLKGVVQSGCLDTRFALAGALVAKMTGEKTLRSQSEEALKVLPRLTAKDLTWLMDHFGFLCYPPISNISPVIAEIKEDKELLRQLVQQLTSFISKTIASNFIFSSMQKELAGLPFSELLMNGFSTKHAREDMARFRRELSNFKDLKAFKPLVQLADFFPEGCITEIGYSKMLGVLYADHGIGAVLDEFLTHQMKLAKDSPVEEDGFQRLIKLQSDGCLKIITAHVEDLHNVPKESISELVDYFRRVAISPENAVFLIKIRNLLLVRRESGEAELAPVILKLDDMILKSSKSSKKKSVGRKRG